jgi:lipopolysaccharide transport system permease protein
MTMLLFLSPIFYPPEALPEHFQAWIQLNPLTLIIMEARAVLLWGEMPDLSALAIYSLCSFALMVAGYAFFQKTRAGFADVL